MIGLFVSHGSPTILVEDIPWKKLMREVGEKIRSEVNPETVVVISPHFISWSGKHLVEVQEKLECIQDYYGFPDELYKFCYSADNDVELARQIVSAGKKAGLEVEEDSSWGLDHGAWIPLSYMFPGLRVVSISITDGSPQEHYKLGQVIAQASSGRRVLIVGTGSPTHRLDGLYLGVKPRQSRFDQVLMDLLKEGKFDEIMELPKTKMWVEAQPEGLLNPLYTVLGFVKPRRAEILGYDVPWGGVSMLAVRFE
ncbi:MULTISPECIES: class III extradiol ring-cleavage dioxygenase [Metallosphaera]|uniref:DODA-type extradiol aromatic ring-opening family dioxygenase n=1 Tax=Metallosphaera TaxID=41980 RepID=UPI001F05F470|nr:dioxygenase [Metallosphaera sedula]MCH1771209.1 dioxygenase [Metallosphaera sedula]MCP6729581.1 dioxygenase [Metallosphaera sedula]